jgi:hypothetical protein
VAAGEAQGLSALNDSQVNFWSFILFVDYSLRPKINAIVGFEICPTKMQLWLTNHKRQETPEPSHIKDKSIARSFS